MDQPSAEPPSPHPSVAGGFAAAAPTARRLPTYARRAIGLLKELAQGGTVVDPAAGTGILAGQLSRAGLHVTAIESQGPRTEQLRRALPAVPIVRGWAEALPLVAGAVDMVAITGGGRRFESASALDEMARVLRPGGTLALVWNVPDDSVPWVCELTALVEERTGEGPHGGHPDHSWVDLVARCGRFGPVQRAAFEHQVATTAAGVVDRLVSNEVASTLDEYSRSALVSSATALLAAHGLQGTFDSPHHTVVHSCTLLGDRP